MKCLKCKSENVEVNGLYWKCNDCGEIDDSTFDMITSEKGFKRIDSDV